MHPKAKKHPVAAGAGWGTASSSADLFNDSLIAEYQMTEGSGSSLFNTGSTMGGDLALTGSPTWSSAGLSFAPTGSYALGSFPSTILNDFSIYCVLKWPVNQRAGSAPFAGAFCANYTDGPRLGVQAQANMGRVESTLDNNPVGTTGAIGNGTCGIIDGKWHVLAQTRIGDTVTSYLDDVVVATEDIAGAQTIDVLQYGIDAPGNVYTMPCTVGYMALYNVGHTKAQVRAQRVSFAAIMTARGESMPALNPFFVLEGDSMINFSDDTFYLSPLLNDVACVNLAVAGSVIADLTARAAAADDYVSVAKSDSGFVVLVTNDLAGGSSAATYVADLKAYCLARRAAGFAKIGVCKLPPRGGGASGEAYNLKRNAANILIAADPSFYDFLVDLGDHPMIGPDGAPDEAIFWPVPDPVHYDADGKAIQVPMILNGCRGAVGLGPSTFPLESYDLGLTGAWSVARILLPTYIGALIRIRRSTGGELDIGADASGNLDTAAITAFVGANSAYVTTIYDQSGLGVDLIQATAANQPIIVSSGTLQTNEGVPCALFVTASENWMYMDGTVLAACIMTSVKIASPADYEGLISSTAPDSHYVSIVDAGGAGFYASSLAGYVRWTDGAGEGLNLIDTSTHVYTVTTTSPVAETWRIGRDRAEAGRFLDGPLTELVIYGSIPAFQNDAEQVMMDLLGL